MAAVKKTAQHKTIKKKAAKAAKTAKAAKSTKAAKVDKKTTKKALLQNPVAAWRTRLLKTTQARALNGFLDSPNFGKAYIVFSLISAELRRV